MLRGKLFDNRRGEVLRYTLVCVFRDKKCSHDSCQDPWVVLDLPRLFEFGHSEVFRSSRNMLNHRVRISFFAAYLQFEKLQVARSGAFLLSTRAPLAYPV